MFIIIIVYVTVHHLMLTDIKSLCAMLYSIGVVSEEVIDKNLSPDCKWNGIPSPTKVCPP